MDSLKERILVVDDCKANRHLTTSLLKTQGYETYSAQSGQECLELIKSNLPDLILLDIMMPEIDGITVCKRLREHYSKAQLPVILLTAKGDTADIAEGLAVGANDYVVKPYDRVVFLARVQNQLAFRKLTSEVESERDKLENALKIQEMIGNVLPDAIAVSDMDGEIVYSNTETNKFYGGRVPDKIKALLQGIFEGDLNEVHSELLSQIVEDSGFEIDREVKVGSYPTRFIHITSKPIYRDHGICMRLWVWKDLSEKRVLESLVEQRVKMESVGLFATGVAHNFNNLMGGIRGASEVLQRIADGSSVGQRCLGIINRSLDQGTLLTKKMVVISSKGNLQNAARGLKEIVQDVIEVQKQLTPKQIEFDNSLDDNLPQVDMAYHHIADVFSNIISNAIDAIGESGHIQIDAAEYFGDCLDISISDSGRGIPDQLLSKVMDPFFSTKQVDHVNGMSMVGNGLGLWNVYNLVKIAGGDIEIASEVGEGTTVKLRLPV